jgi:hypothetical protein
MASAGQPFNAPFIEFSIGDPYASLGSVAYEGVAFTPPGLLGVDIPPSFIISQADGPTFDLHTYLRLAAPGAGMAAWVATVSVATVEHHIQNIETGAWVPVAGAAFVSVMLPLGTGPTGFTGAPPWGVLRWIHFQAFGVLVPAVGTYRMLTHVHGGGGMAAALAAFHERYFMVTP